MALSVGQMIGPYQIVGSLGQGGMAAVYKAYHARLDRHVAIKVLHKAFLAEEGFLTRFEREAQIVAKLEHPHIVPVYDFNEHDGQPYLVMKFIEGRTLKQLLSDGPLTLDQISSLMNDIADALTYAHHNGVLHRDIKPSNIIIDATGVPYLTDFGLARIVKAGPSTMSADMILGTPQYISPEQAAGLPELSPATDVYSLGVVLYELVVGRVPFNADTPYAVVHDHIYTELPRPGEINPAIPEPVEQVLVKALAKKPADRFGTPSEMMQSFRDAVQASGLAALPADRAVTEQKPLVPSIPAPLPPAPPKPPVIAPVKIGKQGKVEFQLDPGDLKNLGRQIKERVEQGAGWLESLGDTIEEAAREGAKAAAQASVEKARQRDPLAEAEARVRKRLKKRDEERIGIVAHTIPYLAVNGFLWYLWGNGGGGFPWPLFPTVFWGIGYIAHLMHYWNEYGPGAARREAIIQQELEREMQRSALYEKPKREPRMRLTDDGELEEVYDEEPLPGQKRKPR
jgi:serine/threonine protein kinase